MCVWKEKTPTSLKILGLDCNSKRDIKDGFGIFEKTYQENKQVRMVRMGLLTQELFWKGKHRNWICPNIGKTTHIWSNIECTQLRKTFKKFQEWLDREGIFRVCDDKILSSLCIISMLWSKIWPSGMFRNPRKRSEHEWREALRVFLGCYPLGCPVVKVDSQCEEVNQFYQT